jgi:hypothetical protein
LVARIGCLIRQVVSLSGESAKRSGSAISQI